MNTRDKRPTKRQKQLLRLRRLDPQNWLVVKNLMHEGELRQRQETSGKNMSGGGYVDKKGRVLFVSSGISDHKSFMTVYFKPNGVGTKRYVSPALPVRKNRKKAEEDLQRYAEIKGLDRIETNDGKKAAERQKTIDFEPVLIVDIQTGKIKINKLNKIWPWFKKEEKHD